MWLLVRNHREPVLCGWRIWLIVLVHVGYCCPVQVCLCVMRVDSELFLWLTSFLCVCVCVCMWRLCVCDMDRLGRNEFIGEVRVALKKLKEGENKRYHMGLERIAQVHTHLTVQHFHVDLWGHIYFISFWIEPVCLWATLHLLYRLSYMQSSPGGYNDFVPIISNLSNFRIKKPTIKLWSREQWWQRRR